MKSHAHVFRQNASTERFVVQVITIITAAYMQIFREKRELCKGDLFRTTNTERKPNNSSTSIALRNTEKQKQGQ